MLSKDRPMKVIVWGPGGLGMLAIRELGVLPEFELVGVRTYSDSKNGVDSGTLSGIEPNGILASTDLDALLAIDADVVLYTARDMATFHTDDEILQLLRAGKRLVTALPYQFIAATRPPEFIAAVEQACRETGAVFHATGVNPDLIGERILLSLTGLCNDVTHVKMQENWDISFLEKATFEVCGYGQSPEIASQSPVVRAISGNFVSQGIHAFAEAIGVEFERVTVENDYPLAKEDLTHGALHVAKGTVGCITTRMQGFLAGADKPLMTVEVNWAVTHAMLPEGVEKVQGWVLTIDGRPSVRTVIDIKADFATGERFIVPGDTRTEAGYSAVVATMLKAVPRVMQAPPGILRPATSQVHWMPDLRGLKLA